MKLSNTWIGLFLLTVVVYNSCQQSQVLQFHEHEIVSTWAEMTLRITKDTPANSPTYASRALGYIGLTMYESVVRMDSTYSSILSQLNGFDANLLPKFSQEIYFPSSLSAGQAAILKHLYMQTSDANKMSIDSLDGVLQKSFLHNGVNKKVLENSIEYGKAIAEIIFEWSKTDGGHRAYLRNFDKEWQHPSFEGSWQPALFAQSISHHPLHPGWGSNRNFLEINAMMSNPKFIPFDTSRTSAYFKQFWTVYTVDQKLTQEQKEIALWWGDDPADTYSPAGHSYFLASKALEQFESSLVASAMTLARVGMAVADAFINCWRWKYHFFTERPNTFIPKYIDAEWESFWPDPPFPAFPSGHAIQSAAAMTVLIELYGERFDFIDSSHYHRERDHARDVDFVPRKFSTFWDIAKETANSRLYGGIHIPHDNDVGLEKGVLIANNVNDLAWKRHE